MKKVILLTFTVFVFTSTPNFGQSKYRPALRKGSVLTGGNLALSFGNSRTDATGQSGYASSEYKYTSLGLTPSTCFFLADGVALGVIASFNTTTQKYEENDINSTSSEYSYGPVFRYYAPGGFFIHGDVTFGKSVTKYTYNGGDIDSDANINKWQLGVGYAIFLNNYVSIEPNIMYRNTTHKHEDENLSLKSNLGEFVIGVGFSIFLHHNNDEYMAIHRK